MNLKETLREISLLFSKQEKDEVIEVTFERLTLADGVTIIESDTFAVDSPVFIVTQDGTTIPMPVGTYELEDGRVLTVDVEGIIASIGDAPAEDAPAEDTPVEAEETVEAEEHIPAEDAPEDAPAEEAPVTRAEYDALVSRVEEIASALNLAKQNLVEKETKITELTTELSKQPAVKKIKHSPQDYKSNNNLKGATKFDTILNIIKNN